MQKFPTDSLFVILRFPFAFAVTLHISPWFTVPFHDSCSAHHGLTMDTGRPGYFNNPYGTTLHAAIAARGCPHMACLSVMSVKL